MISKYEIRKINGEEVLYLYLTYQYEFSKEFASFQEKDLKILSNQFINMNKIPFHGKKVYFIVDGFIVKQTDLNEKNYYFAPSNYSIVIQDDQKVKKTISLKDYLTSILFSFYSQELGDEVLKCICVLFNTYAYKKMGEDGFISLKNDFGNYVPFKEYSKKYQNYNAVLKRIHQIIEDCSCLFLAYHKDYILPFIHYSNSGKTLSYIKYPYLTSVKSLWDMASPNYLSVVDFDYSTLSKLFGVPLKSNSTVHILNHGYSIKFSDKTFSILEVKNILNLKSNDITIIVNRDGLRFITKGNGNSLGLSIYGASCMEMNGSNYISILNYYFPKCSLFKNIKELS